MGKLIEQALQSTRPARGATITVASEPCDECASIHAPRAGRDDRDGDGVDKIGVSIHAPRAGRDDRDGDGVDKIGVSIHAPRAGRDMG